MAPDQGGASRHLSTERLALMTKVARMYHEQGLRQPEIADRLHVSQSRVSRFLRDAAALGIVRTVVFQPEGVHSDIEEAVRVAFGISDVVVTEVAGDHESELLSALGAAGAVYLETTLMAHDRVGISSWSSTLLATVDAMAPRNTRAAEKVVQVIGGVGNPSVQVKATRLTDSLARVTGATPLFLPAPGIVGSEAVRDALLEDTHVKELAAEWTTLTVLLAGIGSLQPSALLKSSGNAISEGDLETLRGLDAVGDICLRFFDAQGALIDSELNKRVIGISSEDLRRVPRKIAIAGGNRKHEAIKAALVGGWVDVLITDLETAHKLVAEQLAR